MLMTKSDKKIIQKEIEKRKNELIWINDSFIKDGTYHKLILIQIERLEELIN